MVPTFPPTRIGTAYRKRRFRFNKRYPFIYLVFLGYFMAMISFHRNYQSYVNPRARSTASHFLCHGWNVPPHPQRQRAEPYHRIRQIIPQSNMFHSEDNAYPLKWKLGKSVRFHRPLSTSTTLFMVKAKTTKKWEIGDLVGISSKDGDDSIQKGEVVSIRGSGWYSVRLLPTEGTEVSNSEIIKCRGNQLQGLAFDINDGKILPRDETSVSRSNKPKSNMDTREEITVSRPDLETYSIVYDLDAELLNLDSFDASTVSGGFSDEQRLRQAAHHATYPNWVVFTDLHCSPATLDTCLEVLDIVHNTALKHSEKCGVLFLGDFWHHRGTLRVDCLNAILGALSSWKVPMVMIPGNHDQVTLGGHNHGLTPLENAYRVGDVSGPLILSHPTRFRNAMFVPHIRDKDLMKAILSTKEARESSALFVHAEVRGALMNDLVVSTQGLPPSVFPSHKHIYSGHFHKPHFIETPKASSTIEYVGSPYQVSLAEAHQTKHLILLDSNWKCQQRIPIDVGRRHFKVSSLEALHELKMEGSTTSNTYQDGSLFSIRRGDRVVVDIPNKGERGLRNSEYNTNLKAEVQSLRDQGVMVELRESRARGDTSLAQNFTTSSDAPIREEMSPESIWRKYLEYEMSRSSLSEEDRRCLCRVGLKILEDLESSSTSIDARQRDLRLTKTTITGFGPFEDTVTYPLANRGLVLLRGSNSDYGPDSNGTGKSSLAMATLWALSGSLDARPASDLKVADVVNDNSKTAKVTVEGFINDVPFVIIRTKSASRGDLTFSINDVDLTTQSAKETQALIEEKLGVDAHILTRVAFYGQHGMNDLLEATDSKLKDELSLIVPLDLWQEATSIARYQARQSKKRVDEMEGMIKLRTADVDALSNRVSRARESKDSHQSRLVDAEKRLDHELSKIQQLLDQASNSNVDVLQERLETVSSEIRVLTDRYESAMMQKETEMKPLDENLQRLRESVASGRKEINSLEMDIRTSTMSLKSAKTRITQIEEQWSLDLSHGVDSAIIPPEHCPTCNQPLQPSVSVSKPGSRESVKQKMELEIENAHQALHAAEACCNNASLKLSEQSKLLEEREGMLQKEESNYHNVLSDWNERFQEIQSQTKDKRSTQNALTSQMSMIAKESQLINQRESAKASFDAEKMKTAHAVETYNNLERELNTAIEFLKDIGEQKEKEENNQAVLSSVGERFGQRGVQTFVLQNTVEALQYTSQHYLDYLSDGSQRLELSLDAGDKILRNAFVRGPDGEFKQRPLSTLSGGQWRRCSLALSFAFAELVASRGRLRSSLLVLDEPLTHLDRSGRTKFGELVRKMIGKKERIDEGMTEFRVSTAIVILQDLAAEELEEAFDGIDTVTRLDGKSRLCVDELTSRN